MAESIATIADDVQRGDRTATDVITGVLDDIDARAADLNCFLSVHREEALAAAACIDAEIAAGRAVGPLAGVPVAVKDNIVTRAGVTTCASRMLEHFSSPYDATAVERLESAGAVVIGKTNCDEFAMGSSNEHSAFGAVRNPWAPGRVPGGSSGGSAAAVAAGLCPVALGSDTGGSIRQPAAMCGVVGVKPSYGRVSRRGLVAFGSSLDQIGPLASSVTDAALLLEAIAGADVHDSTSAEVDVPALASMIDEPVADLRIGVPREYRSDQNHPAVAAAIEEAIDVYRTLGATVVDIDLPLTDYGIATYYVLAPAEASSNLARYDGIRYGHRAALEPGEELFDLYARSRAEAFGPEVQLRIMLGTYVLSAGYYDAYYKRALKVRRLIKQDYDRAFGQCHALLGPTSPMPAFSLGEKTDPLTMYLCDVYTTNANIAGICGMSLPCGLVEEEGDTLPVGLQIQCQAFDEATMFRVARMFERATSWHTRRPGA